MFDGGPTPPGHTEGSGEASRPGPAGGKGLEGHNPAIIIILYLNSRDTELYNIQLGEN